MFSFLLLIISSVTIDYLFCYSSYQQSYCQRLLIYYIFCLVVLFNILIHILHIIEIFNKSLWIFEVFKTIFNVFNKIVIFFLVWIHNNNHLLILSESVMYLFFKILNLQLLIFCVHDQEFAVNLDYVLLCFLL